VATDRRRRCPRGAAGARLRRRTRRTRAWKHGNALRKRSSNLSLLFFPSPIWAWKHGNALRKRSSNLSFGLFGLWRSYSAVTVSSAGPRGLFISLLFFPSPISLSVSKPAGLKNTNFPSTVDPKTPRAKQDFGEFRMQFVGPGF